MATNKHLNNDIRDKSKDAIKFEVISKVNKRQGLCKDCVRAESCSLSHNTNDIIWDCEDYENDTNIAVKTGNKPTELLNPKPLNQKRVSNNPGLCAYCLYNESCSLKSVEGGIWHCAEYA